ncbi:hypothetical protein LCGC14_2141180, partial [marine sediment metagenome]
LWDAGTYFRIQSFEGLPLVINSLGNNVLIGTTTDAGFKLDVNGTGRFGNYLTLNYAAVSAGGLVYADGSKQLQSTPAPAAGSIAYAIDATSWTRLLIGADGTVLGSNGTNPSWGAVPAHNYDTHSGAVPIADIGGVTPQAIIRADTAGTAWEVYGGTTLNRVLKLVSGATNAVWAEGQVDWGELTGKPGTFPPSAHTHDANDWDASTWTQYGIVYASSTTALTTTTAPATGSLLYSPDGTSWTHLAIGGASTVLSSNGTTPIWGAVPAHAYNTHSGSVPIADIGGSVPQGIIRATTAGTAWEVYGGTTLNRVLKLVSGATNYVWAEGQVDYTELTSVPSTFAPSAHTHDANDWDAATWTQYGIVYALSATSLTSTTAPATGSMLYSTDGSSWTPLAIGGANTVLGSNGTTPIWGTIPSHAYSVHTGKVPIVDIVLGPNDTFLVARTGINTWGSIVAGDLPSHTHTWANVSKSGSVLADIANVTITTIATGELLKWNGTAWINNTLAEAGIATSGHNHSGVYLPINDTADNSVLLNGNTLAQVQSHSPASHAYSVHSGSVPIADVGGPVPQGLIRADTVGTAWQVTSSGALGDFLRLVSGATNAVWEAATLTAALVAAGTFSGNFVFGNNLGITGEITDDFIPSVDGRDLGTASKRW